MSTQEKEKCPLCLEVMDLTDRQLKPCKCGYEICLWCWHHIMEMDQKDECGGRCPGCRTSYDKDRILGTSISNQILKELCTEKSNLRKEQSKYQKQRSTKNQLRVENEPKDPSTVRVVQRKLVYIVGMPSEFASEKILRHKKFLGQYGKIENIIIDNIGANQHIPDSGRVYVTFSTEAEAVSCIQAVNGYILDGRLLKATFGVTRYCHIWLSNKVCRKPNCSYVHHKVSPEDMCSKDDVASMCARLQQLLGMDLKGPQQRSGSTLPSPGDCNGRATIHSGNSRDNFYANDDKLLPNDDKLLPNGGSKNPGTLPAATPWDLSSPSGSSSSAVNAVLQRQSEHSSILSNHLTSDAKSQKLAMPGHSCSSIEEMSTSVKHVLLSSGPTEGTFFQSSKNVNVVSQGPNNCSMKQLASGDAKSQASVQLGKDTSSSKKMALAEDDNIDITALQKSQNVNVVSQRSSGRLTVLGRLLAFDDARPKASGQVGNESKKIITSVENEPSDSITLPWQERDGCSSTNEKPLQGNHMQILESIASHSPTALQSLSGSPTMHSNHLSSTEVKSQTSGSEEFSNSNSRLISGNQLQLLNQQKLGHLLPIFRSADTDVPRPMDCPSILDDQLSSADSKYQNSARGDHCLYSRAITVSGDNLQIAAQHTESTLLRRPHSVNCSTEKMAEHGKESNPNGRVINSLVSESSCLMPRDAHSHGIKELLQSSDSDKLVSVSSPTCSALCSTSDDSKPDPCGILDSSDIISWVSECLEDDVDATQGDNSLSISSSHISADAIWRCSQIPLSVSGASNHHILSPYPNGLPCMGGVENTMRCCCALPFVSTVNQKPEHWNGTGSGYMSTGGYAFPQHPMSAMKAAGVGTFLQQSLPPSLYHDWTNGNADSSLRNPQADFSYRMYSLF